MDHGLIDLIAGSCAGVLAKLVEFPFDTIKVRLQVQDLNNKQFGGPLDCLAKTVRLEGPAGLYKGLAIPLLGSVVENSALFVFFGQFLNVFNAIGPSAQMAGGLEVRSLPNSVLSGFCSGVCVSFLLTPIELVKCKLQIQDGVRERRYAGPLDCMRQVIRQHGITGMYAGHSVTALRESFGCAAWFGVYETSCRLLAKPGQSRTDLSALQHVTAGALAGIAYNAALFPADVIKSQVQTAEGAEKQYGYAKTVSRLYNAEGIRGFYRGLGVTLARAVPANMVIFGTYELVARILKERTNHRD